MSPEGNLHTNKIDSEKKFACFANFMFVDV